MFLTKIALVPVILIAMVQGNHLGVFYTICEEYVNNQYIRRAHGVCVNMCFAVVSGLRPGILTISNIRAEDLGCSACVGRSPCGASCPLAADYKRTGNTCDEYPFASTLESGRASGIPAVLRCVPGPENSSGGGQYRAFKAGHAVGDTFDVGVSYIQANGLQFCDPRSVTNDDTEFRYFGGGLHNYRNARDLVVNPKFVQAEFVQAEAVNANNITVTPSLYKTNHGDVFVAFKRLDVGTPTFNVRDGWGEITEMVAEDAFAYDKEYQKSNPVD